ncbi:MULTISPECIES: hypothetical protein [Streptomyces]|uniref:hypothetical protein n=1 Tax=Streptomyces TaxID=1883 RepID=UPI00163C52DE|nr:MULTISPECIES: hypothetical protein [Streptomyces]MBC2877399.1 hypothetical protein [Streptomyces sp. TYQ1024]UBI38199.1 hypothetical protein K7I03_18225 [Streptomyces mobaraensis]UKW30785.1 hypothetical protein MCU78_18185 [Streptomyces sp. TYQ1024]
MRRAILAAALAAVSVIGVTSAQAEPVAPADIDVFTCLDGGGVPDYGDSNPGDLTVEITAVCKGGTHDGETVS